MEPAVRAEPPISGAIDPLARDKNLFTPGPLNTTLTVKQAMLRDLGSQDEGFIDVVREVRSRLLEVAGVNEAGFTAVLVQGSGTFGIESVVSSVIPPHGRLLVLINGAYGERILRMAEIHGIAVQPVRCPETQSPSAGELEAVLASGPSISHVAVVHCETTTGCLNPIEDYARIVQRHGRTLVVDAMSSFGAYPLDLEGWGIDYLVSSANKNLQGVPGLAFVLARRESLTAARGYARTMALDLVSQWEGFERDGQFRFTPPTHALLALRQALIELEAEGGVPARAYRYRRNHQATLDGMRQLGFRPYLGPEQQGFIITSFHYPDHPDFDFGRFYQGLSRRGQVIYPGKLSQVACFRIGHIGQLDVDDVRSLLGAIQDTLAEMGVRLGKVEG